MLATTPQRQHWTQLYDTARWKKLRARQREKEPLCRFCLSEGRVVAATVADHVVPHYGDLDLFWNGELQSLCRPCHERHKRMFEARGYRREVGLDGWPLDENHPANLPRSVFRRFGFGIPHNVRPSGVRTFLVCGPPCAGKSTWVAEHRQPGDVEISLDLCKQRAGGKLWDTNRRILRRALQIRDSMLRRLVRQRNGRAFIVVGAPELRERSAWCEAFGIAADDVVILDTPAEVCIERLRSDPARAHAVAELTSGVQRWWHLYRKPDRIMMPERAA